MARAVSTVLDVALCLLLIGVAVSTLALAVPEETRPGSADSDPTAETLATVTTTIPVDDEHHAHGTLIQHLARATLVDATLDDDRLVPSSYPDAIRREIDNHTRSGIHVTAVWQPYPNAFLGSRISAGEKPPPTADVAATRMTVGSGVDLHSGETSSDSFATAVAEAYIARLFPPERTRVRIVDSRTAPDTADRYRAVAEALGVTFDSALADASIREANDRLAAELADRIRADLRDGNGAATEGPSAAEPGTVEIIVRRWEP